MSGVGIWGRGVLEIMNTLYTYNTTYCIWIHPPMPFGDTAIPIRPIATMGMEKVRRACRNSRGLQNFCTAVSFEDRYGESQAAVQKLQRATDFLHGGFS